MNSKDFPSSEVGEKLSETIVTAVASGAKAVSPTVMKQST